jgi:endonuclease/exonuclease/phosphatase (EEP) superfamily protein YafD
MGAWCWNCGRIEMVEFVAQLKKSKIKAEVTLILIAVFCFFLSFLGRFSWFFDLFNHFTLQYTLGFLIFAVSLSLQKQWKWVCVALVFALLTFGKSRLVLDDPFQFNPPQAQSTFTVLQFNHYLENKGLIHLTEWFQQVDQKPDVVVLQEAVAATLEVANAVKNIYPYQIREQRDHAFGMVILSQTPFLETEKKKLDGAGLIENFALKFSTQPKGAKNPITFFALHAIPPYGYLGQKQRNLEILDAARIVANDSSENKIMIGDWNITPYSPYFSDILKVSGLHFQSYGLFLTPTWTTRHIQPFRIPIDHILYSSSLAQLSKNTVYPIGSDHYQLLAGFVEK